MNSARTCSWTVTWALVLFGGVGACASSAPSATKGPSTEASEPVGSQTAGPAPMPSGTIYGGSLPPAEVKKALGGRRAEVRACYHALLEKNHQAAGKVVIRFTVGEKGQVEDAVLMFGTTLPEETARCIVEVVRGTTFAKPVDGKAVIVYPWEFSPEHP